MLRIESPRGKAISGNLPGAHSMIELWDHSALDQDDSSKDTEKWACARYVIKLMPTAYPDEWMFTMKEEGVQGRYQGFGLNWEDGFSIN